MPRNDQPTDSDIADIIYRLGSPGANLAPGLDDNSGEWLQAITTSHQFLQDRSHPVVFIGEAGVGKSSLVAIAAHLMLTDAPPKNRSSLKSQSLLAIGAGRTTVCEVEIRTADPQNDGGQLGLVIEPMSAEKMDQTIGMWAEDEWRRRQPGVRPSGETDSMPTGQEVARALRAITGYPERVESYKDGDMTRRRTVQPIDAVISQFSDVKTFTQHLLDRANLPVRTRQEWWWDTSNQDSLEALKATVEAVNSGSDLNAMLPERMTLVVPDLLHNAAVGSNLRLIDTRGLDAGVGLFAREDLQKYVSDPRSVIVLCCPFKAAPGDVVRIFLRSMKDDARWRAALPRTLLVLLDHSDADQVNGADGDRLAGQDIKISECRVALRDVGLNEDIALKQIMAMDVLADPRERLVEAIAQRLLALRSHVEDQQRQQWQDASQFLAKRGDALRVEQQAQVDSEIRAVLGQYLPQGLPLNDPMKGLFEAIQATRYASVIYATCRRNGRYRGLNLYRAISSEASRAATAWVDPAVDAVLLRLRDLASDGIHNVVQDHVRLRQKQFNEARLNFVVSYADQVITEVANVLIDDNALWQSCRNEWGRDSGFKNQVLIRMDEWAKRQEFSAHEQMEAATRIPFWPDVVRPTQAPRFTLYASNLRALRHAVWSTESVNLLVGANGAGKTTLLQVLKLLRLAYERGLPEAVSIALGGSSNLRSWGAVDNAPIEIGLDVGEASWRIQLTPREGSVDHVACERLIEQGKEIFSRDTLGGFRYGGEFIETTSEHIGLRVLVDRGAIDRPIREVANFLQRVAVYQEPDLWNLRWQGSNASEDRDLQTRGGNALAVLRRWLQDRTQQHRYDFVIGGMASAFPNIFKTLDFEAAGNTLVARVYRPNNEVPSQLSDEANGVLQLLVLLCGVASSNEGGVAAIDEPENGLHPYALRAFLRKARQWANRHHVTVLLATHSTVLLDEFSEKPECVYVMKKLNNDSESRPTSLDKLCDKEWLEGFKLGDLYEQGEIGSNDDKD